MTDLKKLADMLLRGQLPDNERSETIGLLRTASAETVGTEWDEVQLSDEKWPTLRKDHNADLQAARVAIAAAKADAADADRIRLKLDSILTATANALKGAPNDCMTHSWADLPDVAAKMKAEAASLRSELLTAHAQAEEQSGKRAAMQAAIDAAVAEWDSVPVGGYVNTKRMTDILRPHATPQTAVQPQRQWSSTPPSDRSGRWWNAYGSKSYTECDLVPDNSPWGVATKPPLSHYTYDLWLPWQKGDTRDTLPPVPNYPATVADSATVGSPKADDTRELVARLAEAIRPDLYMSGGPQLWDKLDAIIADARRGGEA